MNQLGLAHPCCAMGLLNHVQEADGLDTFLVSQWQGSRHAHGIHYT